MVDKKFILDKAREICKGRGFKGTYFLFVDFTVPSNEHRLHLVNVVENRIIYSGYTSHGSGSGPINGKNLKFSNIPNSLMSSKGLMKASETYYGKYGLSCKLDGLEPGVNDNVRRRAVVIHPSNYVDDEFVKNNFYAGRSWGCICIDPDMSKYVINCIKNGSYVYVHTNS